VELKGTRAGIAAIAAGVMLAASGCTAAPDGGALVKDWALPPSPVAVVPVAGECHALVYAEEISPLDRSPIDCKSKHYSETVYVGQFTGAAAQLPSPPRLTANAAGAVAEAQRSAYGSCVKQAERYLNHPWYDPNLVLRVSLPTDDAWSAGLRWYSCEIFEHSWDVDDEASDLQREDSLKTRWMATVCVNQNAPGWPTIACSQKHPGEFVGGFEVPVTMTKAPKTQKETQPLYDQCYRLSAIYLNVGLSKMRQLSGVSVWWIDDQEYWPSGRRSAMCFLWTGAKSSTYVTGSAKGRKGKGL
jgi:Septum formation